MLSLNYFEFGVALTRNGIPHRFRPNVLQHVLTSGIGIVLKAFYILMKTPNPSQVLFIIGLQCCS